MSSVPQRILYIYFNDIVIRNLLVEIHRGIALVAYVFRGYSRFVDPKT